MHEGLIGTISDARDRFMDEAADRLGVKRSWIYERTRRKTIPHRRLGKFV